jgi:GAF domain-containing protein
MFQSRAIAAECKGELYRELLQQLDALLAGERDPIANAANTAALLYQLLPDVNWAGFYFLREEGTLVLGPFQGKPACVRIGAGQGVCGAAALRGEPLIVDDTAAFPGHIVCDPDSRSELVVPLIANGGLIGVIDLDSPRTCRFDGDDEVGLVRAAEIYIRATYG